MWGVQPVSSVKSDTITETLTLPGAVGSTLQSTTSSAAPTETRMSSSEGGQASISSPTSIKVGLVTANTIGTDTTTSSGKAGNDTIGASSTDTPVGGGPLTTLATSSADARKRYMGQWA